VQPCNDAGPELGFNLCGAAGEAVNALGEKTSKGVSHHLFIFQNLIYVQVCANAATEETLCHYFEEVLHLNIVDCADGPVPTEFIYSADEGCFFRGFQANERAIGAAEAKVVWATGSDDR